MYDKINLKQKNVKHLSEHDYEISQKDRYYDNKNILI